MKSSDERGYSQECYNTPTKRYCQALDLHNDPELIERYKWCHAPENAWAEISAGIRAVGILNMEIYINENHLFMIVDTAEDFEWESSFARLATMDRQAEWEDYMSQFQVTKEAATSAEKWQLMPRIFKLL